MAIEVTLDTDTSFRPRDRTTAPIDAVSGEERSATRDRLTQRVRIFEALAPTSDRRVELANEIASAAVEALAHELYAANGVAIEDHFRIINALAVVTPYADERVRAVSLTSVRTWIGAAENSNVDDRGPAVAHRLVALIDTATAIVDVQQWLDLPRNAYPSSQMVGQLRATIDIALATASAEEIKKIAKAITEITKATPRGWIDQPEHGKPKESKFFVGPVHKCLIAEGRRIREWYAPQRVQLAQARLELGERSKEYKELRPLAELLRAVAPAIRDMCKALGLPGANKQIKT